MNQPRNGDQVAGRAADAVSQATKALARACDILSRDTEDHTEGPILLKHLLALVVIKDKLRGQQFLFGPPSPMFRKPKKRSRAGTPAREVQQPDLEPLDGTN
jgi:hypothetical protein